MTSAIFDFSFSVVRLVDFSIDDLLDFDVDSNCDFLCGVCHDFNPNFNMIFHIDAVHDSDAALQYDFSNIKKKV